MATAWRQLAHRTRLVRTIQRMLGRAEPAEDLAHDALLKIGCSKHLDTPNDSWGMLQNVARQRVIDHLRAERVRKAYGERELNSLELSRALNADGLAESAQIQEALRRALAKLEHAQREAICLHYLEGLTHQQVADRLNTTANAIYLRIRRGLERMRADRCLLELMNRDDL